MRETTKMVDEAPGAVSTKGRRGIVMAAIPLVIFLALAGVFLKQLYSGTNTHDIPSALIGKPAPMAVMAPLEGLTGTNGAVPGLDATSFKDKITIVNVWASWCAPCRAEHPLLMELSKDSRFQMVGINYKDKTPNALRFLGQLGNPFARVGIDPRGSNAIDWGVYGVPETFIVGRDGTILHKHVGPISEQSLKDKILPELEKAIAAGAGQG